MLERIRRLRRLIEPTMQPEWANNIVDDFLRAKVIPNLKQPPLKVDIKNHGLVDLSYLLPGYSGYSIRATLRYFAAQYFENFYVTDNCMFYCGQMNPGGDYQRINF